MNNTSKAIEALNRSIDKALRAESELTNKRMISALICAEKVGPALGIEKTFPVDLVLETRKSIEDSALLAVKNAMSKQGKDTSTAQMTAIAQSDVFQDAVTKELLVQVSRLITGAKYQKQQRDEMNQGIVRSDTPSHVTKHAFIEPAKTVKS